MNNQYPNNNQAPTPNSNAGRNAKILGIVSLVAQFLCCCLPIVSPILAIIALVMASRSKNETGMLSSDALAGKVCAIIALVLTGLSLAFIIVEFFLLAANPDWFERILQEYPSIEEYYPGLDLSSLPFFRG